MHSEMGLHLLQQDVFQRELGLPRWGCLFKVDLGGEEFFFNRALTEHETVLIYWKCRAEWDSWNNAPVLEMREPPFPPGKEYELFLNNPTRVMQIGCSYFDNEYTAAQIPDLECTYPEMKPVDFGCQYIAKQLKRPLGFHWVLAESTPPFTMIYNPLVSCTGIWTGRWRGIRIWKR